MIGGMEQDLSAFCRAAMFACRRAAGDLPKAPTYTAMQGSARRGDTNARLIAKQVKHSSNNRRYFQYAVRRGIT